MRVLMLGTPVTTHFTTLVPLAWALRAAGHEVLVAGQPDLVGAARSAGLSIAVVGTEVPITLIMRVDLPPGVRPIQHHGRTTAAGLLRDAQWWGEFAAIMLPKYLELAREWQPDLIVSEQMEFCGPIIGALLGRPTVRQRWGVYPVAASAWEVAPGRLRQTCRDLGLPDVPDATVDLDPCPPSAQAPGVPAGLPVRPMPFNGAAEVRVRPERHPGRRRVAVSLGNQTMELNGMPLVRSIVAAFDGLPGTEAVITLGDRHRDELGKTPANVRVVAPTPLEFLLPHCDAVLHHGGVGTALSAVCQGLPQLVLPQLSGQFDCADRLARTGAAISLDDAASQDDPAAVRGALRALLETPDFAAAASALLGEVGAMPPPGAVVHHLETLGLAELALLEAVR